MADIAAPTISFAGLVGIDAGEITVSRGATTDVNYLTTPIVDQVPEKVSDLVIEYNGETLTLTDCAVADCAVHGSEDNQYLRVVFLDRRWKWALTEIVGKYNIRKNKNSLLHEKTPHELVELLFAAMGEVDYDITDLPNVTRPYSDWRNSRCDTELNEILTALGCDIAPDLSAGEIRIVKLGAGAALPTGPWKMNPSENITYAPSPEKVQVTTDDARFQCLFECEAVGVEPDGTIVPVGDLSYTPAGGWAEEDPNDFDGVTGTYTEDGVTRDNRDLALASVDRWFRIKRVVHDGYEEAGYVPGDAELNPPGFEDAIASNAPDIEKVEQLLPLQPALNDTYVDAEYGERRRKMRLYGSWYDDSFESVNENTDPSTIWKDGFSVDLEKGIVKLSRPVRFLNGSGDWEPVVFYLYAVCQAEFVGLNRKVYYGEHVIRDGVVTPETVLTEERLDIIPKYNARYVQAGGLPVVDSLDVDTEVYDQIAHSLDQLEARLVEDTGATAEYADLKIISPDGAIEQVQWEIGPSGTTTRVGRFTRVNGFERSYKEAKQDMAILKAADEAKRLGRREPDAVTIDVDLL
jgi:hypothetical protein